MWPDRVSYPGPPTYELRGPALNAGAFICGPISAPDKKGKGDNLGIIFHITTLKHMLQPIIRTVLQRRF